VLTWRRYTGGSLRFRLANDLAQSGCLRSLGFLVIEVVRHWFNHRKYTALMSTLQPERVTARWSQVSDQLGATGRHADEGTAQEVPPTS
jgi:hypothetical protein